MLTGKLQTDNAHCCQTCLAKYSLDLEWASSVHQNLSRMVAKSQRSNLKMNAKESTRHAPESTTDGTEMRSEVLVVSCEFLELVKKWFSMLNIKSDGLSRPK